MARIRKLDTSENATLIKWKLALYVRLSREDGNDVSVSVENQKAELQTFLESFDEPYEIVDFYVDDGYTGTDSDRENFQRMLNDIKANKVNCVIVRDPSRLSRNYLEAGMYMEQLFVKLNVRFISLSLPQLDSYKNPAAMNSIAVPIQNVINDDFCRQTSQKIRGVFNMKRSHGEFIGAFAPYGYLKDKNDKSKLVVDPEAAQVIKDIFQWYTYDGMSKRGIVRKLNEIGIPCPAKYKTLHGFHYHNAVGKFDGLWNLSTVSLILSNEMYIGNMVQGRQRIKSYKVHDAIRVPKDEWFIVENTHEPIIEKETFALTQSLLRKDTRTVSKNYKVHKFAGLLKCADCGKGMRKTETKYRVYYICRTHYEKSSTICTRHTIREDVLEKAVLTAIQAQISLVDDMQKIIAEIEQHPVTINKSERLEKTLKMKEIDLSKIQTVIDNLYLDYKIGEITQEDYHRMKTNFQEKKEKLVNEIKNIKEEISLLAKGIKKDNSYFKTFLKDKNIRELDRAVLVCLIDKILIHEDKHITIVFNFEDQYMRIMNFIESNKKNATNLKLTRKS